MHLHTASARTGIQWIAHALRTVCSQPLKLISLLFLGLMPVLMLSGIPWLGRPLAAFLIVPLTLGMLVCIHATAHQQPPGLPQLLIAFQPHQRTLRLQLLILGGLYAVCELLILLACSAVDPQGFYPIFLHGQHTSTPQGVPQLPMHNSFALAMLLFALLTSVHSMLFGLASALVYWHRQPALKALFFACICCKHNWRALGAVLLGLLASLLGVGIMLTLVNTLLGALGSSGGLLSFIASSSAMLFAITLVFAVQYFAFRGCFRDSP